MSKALGTVISANTMRASMGLDPAPNIKHHLVIWQEEGAMITFKCDKCSKGKLTLPREVVRLLVTGSGFGDFLLGVAWGSWPFCREDQLGR